MLACYQGAASKRLRRTKTMLPRPFLTLVLPHLMMIMPAAATYVTDANISTAVAAWRADPAAAQAHDRKGGSPDTDNTKADGWPSTA